ncbi:hypothetical protein HanHA300_Chr02g0063561 [Helianthus annuus]|nr:hypothetical protein HanHA300_Chr02g0063561 [Helianthus annuus]KAJ0619497.1 hypothetical protein HanHA89_Chr02g0072011 [Helianthus annuus]
MIPALTIALIEALGNRANNLEPSVVIELLTTSNHGNVFILVSGL